MPFASRTNRIPVSQAVAARDRSAPYKVSGKLLTALHAMVWSGCTRREAAERSGMSEHGLWSALKKAHVRSWYLAEIDVLRTSERARNIHALVDVRDRAENSMARVAATKALEQISDVEAARGGYGPPLQPGLVIQIVTAAEPPRAVGPVIEHNDGDPND
jgi:hypothetical protein